MNICNYCEHENTCTNKPLATTHCKDYKEKSEELKPCPSLSAKDKEIARLKEDLEIQRMLAKQACFESNRAYDEVEK